MEGLPVSMSSKPDYPACSWCLSIAFKFTPVKGKRTPEHLPCFLKPHFGMLSVVGLAKAQGSQIRLQYFGSTLENTQFSGYHAERQMSYQLPQCGLPTRLKADRLITAISGIQRWLPLGRPPSWMLQDSAGRGVWGCTLCERTRRDGGVRLCL